MTSEVKGYIKKVWDLLADPRRWTQGAYEQGSRDSTGTAEKMCILGACQAVQRRDRVDSTTVGLALRELKSHMPAEWNRNIPHFNDSVSHKEVSRLFAMVLETSVQIEEHGALRLTTAAAPLAIEDLSTEAPD